MTKLIAAIAYYIYIWAIKRQHPNSKELADLRFAKSYTIDQLTEHHK